MTTYARALGVDEPAVRVMHELANHHTVLFRHDFMRRSHIADMPKGAVHRDGFLATARAFAAVERGSRVPVNLSDGRDHWAWVEKPLAQARAELNITPL